MSTDSFLCVLRKFIARRSKPRRTLSDNGVNFVGAARVLRDSLEELNNSKSTISFGKKISNGVSILPQPVTWVEFGRK